MRGDDGFEDREGHQAPFTLPEEKNVRPARNASHSDAGGRSTSNIQREKCRGRRRLPVTGKLAASPTKNWRLFEFLDRFDDVVEFRPVAGLEFGMEEFAIGANLESAAARGNQRERLDALAELKDLGRQTDGLWRVISNDAVFDRDLGVHRQTPFRERSYRFD